MNTDLQSEIAYLEKEFDRFLREAIDSSFACISAPEADRTWLSRLSRLSFILLQARGAFEDMLARLGKIMEPGSEADSEFAEHCWRVCAIAGSKLSLFYAEMHRYSEAATIFDMIPVWLGCIPEHSSAAIASSLISRHLVAQNDLDGAKRVFFKMRPLESSARTLLVIARTAYWLVQRFDFILDADSAVEVYNFLRDISPRKSLKKAAAQKTLSRCAGLRGRAAPLTLVGGENPPVFLRPDREARPELTLVGAADPQDTHAGSDAEDLREFAKIQIRTAERIITMFWQKGRPEEAQWVYNTLLELSSPNVISTRLARSGSKILSENVSKGRWAEVEDIFARIACDKTRGFMALKAQAAYELALHHSETGNLPKALRYYDYIASQDDSLSLQFDPGNALCSLMSLCRRLGHTEEAEKRFWRYMESPGSAPSQQNSKAHCALKLIEHLSSSFSDPDCFRKALKIWDTLLSQADAVNLDKLKAGGLVFMVEGAALSGDTELALRLFEAFDSIEGASRAFPKAQTALALIRSLLSADRLADAERVYQAYRPMDLKESILKHQFAAAGAITGWLARRGQYRESARDICGGLLKIPPMSAFLGQQVELATRLLKLSVDAGNADHAGEMYRLLSELWASAEEPVMNGAEKALLRARLEASWSESSLGLIELYAALGRHREAHTIFQDLYDLSETPLLLSNRAKARSIISRLWTESLNTSS